METSPLVSICCITYNHEKFIRDALEGFLMQKTTFPIEIIIHDDASTDNTPKIINEYKSKYPELFVTIFQTENQYSQGIKPLPTYVFPKAKGKYIALCEGDDYWTDPYKLQKQVDFLEENKEYIACFTDAMLINSVGDILNIKHSSIIQKKWGGRSHFNHYDVLYRNPACTLTLVIRKETINQFYSILNDKRFRQLPYSDWGILSLLTKEGMLKFLPITTASYRIHENGIYSGASPQKKVSNIIKQLNLMNKIFPKNKSLYERTLTEISYISKGKLKKKIALIFKFQFTLSIKIIIYYILKQIKKSKIFSIKKIIR